MYRGPIRVMSPQSEQRLVCDFSIRTTRAGFPESIRDSVFIKFTAADSTRLIQTRFHETHQGRKDLAVGQDVVRQLWDPEETTWRTSGCAHCYLP